MACQRMSCSAEAKLLAYIWGTSASISDTIDAAGFYLEQSA